MDDNNNQLVRETNESLGPQMTVPVPKGVFRVLTVVSVSASVVGFLIIISILVAFRTYETIFHTHGLIVGFLLLGGGLVLLTCLIFVNQATRSTISTDSSYKNRKGHNS
ncbi:MAG: hypothetical protein ACFE95_11295 [Candidatus Hodarchaeota archaeon]